MAEFINEVVDEGGSGPSPQNKGKVKVLLGQYGKLFNQRKYDEAQKLLEEAEKLDPENPVILNHLGIVQMRLDNPASALDNFIRVQELDPHPTRSLNTAYAYSALGRDQEAVRVLEAVSPEKRNHYMTDLLERSRAHLR